MAASLGASLLAGAQTQTVTDASGGSVYQVTVDSLLPPGGTINIARRRKA